ncbi:MAG: hypothetical protein QOI60_1215 [Actinomycetota bacterium]|nr:hypothetical protein [Actinomycetota bacterium]
MPRVFPFEGLTYAEIAGPLDQVTAPPYDVISDARRREYLLGSPYSVVHLDLAEGSEDPTDPGNRYERAAGYLEEWQRKGALLRAPTPRYYAYEMAFTIDDAPRRIRGLFLALSLEPWGAGVIPHERTMPGPIEDRLNLLRATRTHLSAVYGTIAGPSVPLGKLLDEVTASTPTHDTTDERSVRHRMWTVPVHPEIATWFADAPVLIADGHHRYTTALRYRDEMHAQHGPGPWDRVLALLVDAEAEHLPVLPFHRLQLTGTVPTGGAEVASLADALEAVSDDPPVVAAVTRGPDGPRYAVVHLTGGPPAVRALHDERLRAATAAGDLAFTPSSDDALAAVSSGRAVAAWLLPATTPERIRDVVERGERLPQKSTYFWPKPRTGMVMMPVDDASPE